MEVDTQVRVGSEYRAFGGVTCGWLNWHKHPEYDSGEIIRLFCEKCFFLDTHSYDIGLIELDCYIRGAQMALLPSSTDTFRSRSGQNVWVAGWGRDDGKLSSVVDIGNSRSKCACVFLQRMATVKYAPILLVWKLSLRGSATACLDENSTRA